MNENARISEENAAPNSRREFLKTSSLAVTAGALAPYIAVREKAFAANAETLRVGLIGCGGRGTGAAAQALAADKNIMLTAMGDVFENRIQGALQNIKKES